MRRVVSLWLPFWPTQRLRRRGAAPSGQPLATWRHDGVRRRVVDAACPQAQAAGLRAGMALAQARAMLPGLAVAAADPQEDARALGRLAAWCLRLSPLTAPDLPDGVWIDATGCAHMHGGEAAMLERLLARLERQGISGRAACAATPGAAHALARFGRRACTVVPDDATVQALSPLPVAALRLDADTVAALRQLGLDRVELLEAVPRASLARRLGAQLLDRLDQALGRLAEPIGPVQPSSPVCAVRCFAEPLSTAEALAAAAFVLVSEACAELEKRGEGARRLALVFERLDSTTTALEVGTALAVRDAAHLGRLLAERLDVVDPGPGVESMRLLVRLSEPLAWRQEPAPDAVGGQDGRVGDAPSGPASFALASSVRDLAPLLDRLANRLGSTRVYWLHPVQSDVPERSQRPVSAQDGPAPRPAGRPAGGARAAVPAPVAVRPDPRAHPAAPCAAAAPGTSPLGTSSLGTSLADADRPAIVRPVAARAASSPDAPTPAAPEPGSWMSPWPRPVRLLARPEPVQALEMLPDHPPRAFTWRAVRHRVRHADGPERIAGEWWRSDAERWALRDYWAVEDEQGRRFWLFRQGDGVDPATGTLSWFLHGFF